MVNQIIHLEHVSCTQSGNSVSASWNGVINDNSNAGSPTTGSATFTLQSDNTPSFSVSEKGSNEYSASVKGVNLPKTTGFATQCIYYYTEDAAKVVQTSMFKEYPRKEAPLKSVSQTNGIPPVTKGKQLCMSHFNMRDNTLIIWMKNCRLAAGIWVFACKQAFADITIETTAASRKNTQRI